MAIWGHRDIWEDSRHELVNSSDASVFRWKIASSNWKLIESWVYCAAWVSCLRVMASGHGDSKFCLIRRTDDRSFLRLTRSTSIWRAWVLLAIIKLSNFEFKANISEDVTAAGGISENRVSSKKGPSAIRSDKRVSIVASKSLLFIF